MESSRKKSGGVEIPKKNRSLDLKSLYESRFSEVRGSKKKISDENDGETVKKKKRKSKKEVPLSCFESDAKRSRKEDVNGVKSELALGKKSKDRGEGLHDISLPLGNNGSSFNIPKRPRGSVGRKRVKSDQGSEPTRHSESATKLNKSEDGVGPSNRVVQVTTPSSGNDLVSSLKSIGKVKGSISKSTQKSDSKPTVNSSSSNVKVKQKVRAEVVKANSNGQSGSASHVGKEYNRVVNNKVASPTRQQKSSRMKKKIVVGKGKGGLEASAKKSQPSVGSSSDRLFVDFVDDDDDDEENLEQNAARMLSSRFDPSCTGFSSKRKSSVKADGLLFSSSPAKESFADGQSPSADEQSRNLRPRRENVGKGVSRKRRHFYEIHAEDLDPYWVLNRRIKIFWPLDESWYYGLVNDYNSETKHHHIKYDDREEEIVNLQDEKFKLLLLPSELPDNSKSRKRSRTAKDLHNGQTDPLDSKPIASWLASQRQRVKASSKSLKHLPLVSSLSSEKTDNSNSDRNNPDCESASMDKSERHAVYVRKKYHKTSEGGGSVSRDAEPHRTAPWAVTSLSQVSVDLPPTKGGFCYQGKLRLKDVLLKSEEVKFQICLPALLSLRSLFETGNFWMLHHIYMLQHGLLVTSSPAVILQMLFIDTSFGLRFLLYDGCLNQAVALILEILIVFSQFDGQWNGNKKLPVTSIRFQLSSSHNPRKQHVFAFYSFSKLKSPKWLYLNAKILQHCHLTKQLPISDCTYDNIKELECDGLKHALNEGFKKKLVSGILPVGVSREARNKSISESAFSMAVEPGKVPQFALSISAAPTFFLTLHLQLLMEHNFARTSQPEPYQYEPREEADKLIDASKLSSAPTSNPDGMVLDNPSSEQVDAPLEGQDYISRISSDVELNVPDAYIHKPNTSSFRNSVWPDGSLNLKPNGFSNGPKKPRTQVQYTLPFVGCDNHSEKQKSPSSKSLPCKRIRKASLKRISNGSNVELLNCVANVLVTHGDKGWREYGAHIVLEVDDNNEWRLAVKLSGVTKYSYKVKHILQPGSTNRFSYAMMWKGGKDWVLEFPDRSQWMIFKEMHEECYDRNIRAASVKNIPIPGVRLVEDSDDYGNSAPFIRNPTKYFRQLQNDVEMAMDHSHVLYDMDSDDEEWLTTHNSRVDKHEEISEEFFEKAMNVFEKVSYSQRRVEFTDGEIEELLIGMGSSGAAKGVHHYWREKREKMGMPLIRHLQPPLWERYQQQLKEWEHNGLYSSIVQPPMFAFCLRPRGLELPNKGSKQRSHRRLHDTPLFGRRSNGHVFGDDFSDVLPSLRASTRVSSHFYLSNGVSEWKGSPKFFKNKSRNPFRKRNVAQQWSMGVMPELSSHRQRIEQWDSSEFRLRDACGAAQLALKTAKHKREKAERLLHRADLAVHKAVFAIMTADAVKDSFDNS